MNSNPKTPNNCTEYKEMIWAFCRDCTGVRRTVAGACKKEDCQLFPVYSMPRTMILHMDFSQYIDDVIEIAKLESVKYDKFTMEHIRRQFYLKNGNGKSLNYGAIVNNVRWREIFRPAGEVRSNSVRTHSKKVLQWTRRSVGNHSEGAATATAVAVPETAGR